jgi:hypothetical protein
MLAVGFIPRLDGTRKIRRVSDGSCDGHVTEWIGRRRPQGHPDSTVADATGISWASDRGMNPTANMKCPYGTEKPRLNGSFLSLICV